MKRLLVAAGLSLIAATASAQSRPNIVLIYMDDVGYGDPSSYGATAVQTPNIDRLARQGLRFTDAHSPAATCTPSRYALMTGEYAFRKKGTGILPGDAALVIEPGRTTLPSLLRKAGYTTGIVGKWHLGLGPQGGPDWNGEIRPGPPDVGFDYAFIMAATGDRVPTVYIENGSVVGLSAADPIKVSYAEKVGDWPTGKENPDLLKVRPSHGHDMTIVNGISRIGWMAGGKTALWKDEDMADAFTGKAVDYIQKHAAAPFFLYFATHDIHVPRVPHPRFVGKSGMGPRGDALLEADWSVGQILDTLDRLKLTDNTIVIVTAHPGPGVDDGYQDEAVAKLGTHKPAGPLRGGKGSNFEAGTRIPFIVGWPGQIASGVSAALVSQIDLLASLASFTGQKLADADAPDSFNVLPALVGKSPTGREHLVTQSSALSLRQGSWKYIEPNKGAPMNVQTNTETGNDPNEQLYDLSKDLGERQNVAGRFPDLARQMASRLAQIREKGRSR
ncbi:MAG: arylsulfatase [Vicinamibacterales bacterium]